MEKIAKSGKLEAADFRGRESYQRLKNAPIITTSPIIFPVTTIGKGSSLEVKGKIGKREHSFVVDTGTSRSIIKTQLVNNDQVFLKDKYKLRTATGELVPVKGTSNISFELGGKPFVHEFLVASITDECILGIDFMRQHEISLNMKGGTLKQGTTEIPLHYGSTEDKDTCVRVMRNETIPAHSESIIWGSLQNNNLGTSTGTVEADQMASAQGIEVCQQMRVTIPQAWTEHGMREEQMKDEDIAPIFEWMERGVKPQWQQIAKHGEITKSYWAQWDSLAIQRGVLYRKWETEDGENFHLQLILPKTRVKEVLEEIHNGISGGHLGVNKTMEKVRQRFYWLRYKHDVEEWCRRCEVCEECKGPQRKTKGLMQLYNVGVPFERIALDVAGPFPITKNGNRYILVIADYFTKWTEAIALPNQEAETIVETLINIWVSRFGVPLDLHSDQGRNFESKIFQELCQSLGIHKTRTTALHPQSDGMVERFNRTMEQHLSKMVGEQQDDWDKYLQLFLMAYRGAVHSTTGVSPAKMTFGREIRLPADIAFGKPEEPKQTMPNYMSKFEEKMATIHRTARQNIGIISDQSKARYDRQTNAISFKEGDQVWFYNSQRKKGRSPKLQRDWEGPYRVIKKINDVVYRVQKGPRLKMKVVHSNRLAKYNGEDAESVRDEQI